MSMWSTKKKSYHGSFIFFNVYYINNLDEYGLIDISFILWVITLYYFNYFIHQIIPSLAVENTLR